MTSFTQVYRYKMNINAYFWRTCDNHSNDQCWMIIIIITSNVFVVNGQVIKPIEGNSSPSSVTATKGSSVWLHWNYTYIGDGTHPGGIVPITTNYNEQVIRFNSTSQPTLHTLAKRIGQNGALALESPVPAPFNGRVEVISSNSTLVIHNHQYNDSTYQFSSTVEVYVNTGGGPFINTYALRPIVNITVNEALGISGKSVNSSLPCIIPGISTTLNQSNETCIVDKEGAPESTSQPPCNSVVNQSSNLSFKFEFNGNPKPSANFRWLHLPSSTSETAPSIQLYPYVYSSTFLLSNINATYCGRILKTVLTNRMGYSTVKVTHVTVLLRLDNDFSLEARHSLESKCVEVKWNKVEHGACYVRYEVAFKNESGNLFSNEIGYNIGEMKKCSLPNYTNITEVKLTVSFRSVFKTVTAKVSTKVPTTASTSTTHVTTYGSKATTSADLNGSNNMTFDEWKTRDSALVAVIVILIIAIIIILMIGTIKLRKRPIQETQQNNLREAAEMHYMDMDARSKEPELNYAELQETQQKSTRCIGQAEMHYTELKDQTKEKDSTYAKLQGEYEEVGGRIPQYINV